MSHGVGGTLGIGCVGKTTFGDPQRDSVRVGDIEDVPHTGRIDDLRGVTAFGGRAAAQDHVEQRGEFGVALDDRQAGHRQSAVADHDALAVVVDAEVVGLAGQFGMNLIGGDDAVEVGVNLTAQHRVGEPAVVEVTELHCGLLIAGIGRVSPAPGVHVQRKPDLGVRVELVNDVIGRRVSRRLVE